MKRFALLVLILSLFGCNGKTGHDLVKNRTIGDALGTTYAITYITTEDRFSRRN